MASRQTGIVQSALLSGRRKENKMQNEHLRWRSYIVREMTQILTPLK
jgi:hypothetical protein